MDKIKKESIKELAELEKQVKDLENKDKGLFEKIADFLFGKPKPKVEKHVHKLIYGKLYEESWGTYDRGIKMSGSEHTRTFQDGICECGYIEKREIIPIPTKP